jgi:hypothetical protein
MSPGFEINFRLLIRMNYFCSVTGYHAPFQKAARMAGNRGIWSLQENWISSASAAKAAPILLSLRHG